MEDFRPKEYKEFQDAWNNFLIIIARELGIFKLLDLLTKWLTKGDKMNLNEMAKRIAKKETGSREVDITQIKEIMKLTFEELGKFENEDVIAIINRYRSVVVK